MEKFRVGIVRVSNDCASNDKTDEAGQELTQMINEGVLGKSRVVKICHLPADKEAIKKKIDMWSRNGEVQLILTVGGKLSKDAVSSVTQTPLRGISEPAWMVCSEEADKVTGGTFGKTLIVNLPSGLQTSKRCLRSIAQGVTSCISLLNDTMEN